MNRTGLFMVCLVLGLFARNVLADPTGRVGRISLVSGQVDFQADPYDLHNPALVNWPITVDNIIRTPRFARAEVRIGSTALRMDDETEVRFEQLDDQFVRVRMERGHVYVRLRTAENAQQFELSTPQGRLTVFGPATFRVDFSIRPDSTTINLFSGRGQFDNKGVIWPLEPGKQFSLVYDETVTQNLYQNEFDNWCLARDRAEEKSASIRYLSAETTGYEELDRYGVWRESAEYGTVWYPTNVPTGWAPYRHGRWTWLQPWGWTWVDDEPWGYAPSHYGRWAWLGGRWGWTPGRITPRPVWTPAVVGWVVHQSSGNTVVQGNPNIGWFPLAPGTTYQPVYSVSARYLEQVNGAHSHRRPHPETNNVVQNGITTMESTHFNSNKIVVVKQGVITMVDSKTSPNQLRQYERGNGGRPIAPPAPVGHELRPANPAPNPLPNPLPNPAPVANPVPGPASNPAHNPATNPATAPIQVGRPRPTHQPVPAVQPVQVQPPQQPTQQPIQQPTPSQRPIAQPTNLPVVQQPIPLPVPPRPTQQPIAPPMQPRPPVVQQPVVQQPVVQQPIVQQPVAQPVPPRQPVVPQPVVQQPVVQQPIAQPTQSRQPVVHEPIAQPVQTRPPVVNQPIPQPVQPRPPVMQPPPAVQQPPVVPPVQAKPPVAPAAPAQPVPPKPSEPKPTPAKTDASTPKPGNDGDGRRPRNERGDRPER